MLLFALSIFISSFLLFQVQPLIGKYILPWFGSSSAVWSASLLFFQMVLTGGYAYAYALTGRLHPRRQAWLHGAVLGISVITLGLSAIFWHSPLLPGVSWQPVEVDHPFWDVIKVLAVAVGLPYFLLATNSTLLQAWFNRLNPDRSPYRLYALSNLASLLGLLSYPVLFEPQLPLTLQARGWVIGYGIYALTAILLAWRFQRRSTPPVEIPAPSDTITQSMALDTAAPGFSVRLLWVLLPSLASLLLLATTNQITQEIAVIPFLWILPLSLYLASFILCFESDRWYGRGRFSLVLALAVGAFGLTASKGPLVDIKVQITAYCLLFFVCCMICHGELARLRPAPRYLTSFYLLVSVGGAVGGLFVNLVAPLLFAYYWELPLGLLLCFALFLVLTVFLRQGRSWKMTTLFALLQITVLVGSISLPLQNVRAILRDSVWTERNFYGVLRVKKVLVGDEQEPAYQLVNGITLHGLQFIDPQKRHLPTTYYSEDSGAGLAFTHYPDRSRALKVAVLGLGTGTQAVYGRSGDTIRFYEINPAVARIAQGEGGFFTFLQDSPAHIEVVLGDARLSLERELEQSGSQGYDLIFLDTFSSDSIPVHLLTRQAFALYLQHLKPDGILAVHTSNIHLDLEPVVTRQAEEFRLRVAMIAAGKTGPGTSASTWMLLTTNQAFLDDPAIRSYVKSTDQTGRTVQLWTDDYSNLFQILR